MKPQRPLRGLKTITDRNERSRIIETRGKSKRLPMTCAISPFEPLTFSSANSACHLNEHRSMYNNYNTSHYGSVSLVLAGAQCSCRWCMALRPAHMSIDRNTVSGSSKTKRGPQSIYIDPGTSIDHRPESGTCDALHLETAALRPNMDSC